MSSVSIVIFLTITSSSTDGARILGLFPFWPRSHHSGFIQPVMKSLARAGHQVTVYSPFPLESPHANYTDVLLENVKPDNNEIRDFFVEVTDLQNWKCLDFRLLLLMYKEFMGDPQVIELIAKREKFDLIFTEAYTLQEHVLVLGHILKAPIISLQSSLLTNLVNSHAGNELSLPYIPDSCLPFSNKLSFYERLFNTFSSLKGLYFYYNYDLPALETIMRAKFPDMPPLTEMAKNVTLYFVNDHVAAGYAQARTPNIVPVGGIHIEPPAPLPQQIQQFMDEATYGVIFFSLGTIIPDELKPKKYFNMIVNVFKNLKQRVIWKTSKKDITWLPENVLTLNWAPQQSILAHPNCVLFITHGGLLSQHEAIHFGVPVVAIPHFFDHHRNVGFYEEQGVGVKVGVKDMSFTTLTAAVREVLRNSRFEELCLNSCKL